MASHIEKEVDNDFVKEISLNKKVSWSTETL